MTHLNNFATKATRTNDPTPEGDEKLYGNESGGSLAATGVGVLIAGIWVPLPIILSVAAVAVAGGIFLFVAYRKRGNRRNG